MHVYIIQKFHIVCLQMKVIVINVHIGSQAESPHHMALM